MTAGLHHLELWVSDLEEGREQWGWLLAELGWLPDGTWGDGSSWRAGAEYLVIARPPALAAAIHDRRLPGLNHLAFHGGDTADVDRLMQQSAANGWSPLYADRYPHAGGPLHYAAYLQNSAGFKVEIVAAS